MLGHKAPQPTNSLQLFFMPPTPTIPSRSGGPLSPKAFGANVLRFICCIASAPNAKGLFALGSHSNGATTKNGLLSPGEPIPPMPESNLEQGTNSLETLSSVSSRGAPSRQARSASTVATFKTKDRVTNAQTLEGPGKIAFRRTYSSHSIKVKSVSSLSSANTVVALSSNRLLA